MQQIIQEGQRQHKTYKVAAAERRNKKAGVGANYIRQEMCTYYRVSSRRKIMSKSWNEGPKTRGYVKEKK